MFRLIHFCALISVVITKQIHDGPSSIINGDLVTIEDFPYYAFIERGNKSLGRQLYCGGSIIQSNIVLTSAHCLYNPNIQVFVGITTLDDLFAATPYEVKKAIRHPYYFYGRHSHDIGLIILTRNIILDQVKFDTIELSNDLPPIGARATVVGFGKAECIPGTDRPCNNPSSNHLRSAVLRVIMITRDRLIYTRGRNKHTCYGDSGGPVVYDGKVVALICTGERENCTGYDLNTPILPFYEWIKHFMHIYGV